MKEYYELNVAGLSRKLPLCKINNELYIAAFVILGDVELTVKCAGELIGKMPDHDVLITAEAKGIPLIHEIARQTGVNDYIVARKASKLYMKDAVSAEVRSITTSGVQTLFISGAEAERLKGKRALIIDDVISTGESICAVENLVAKAGGTVAGKMAILAEGDALTRDDIIYLEKLPLFDKNGEAI